MKAATFLLSFCASVCLSSHAADLQPLLAQPDQVVLQDDFAKPGAINKDQWGPRQGTQWLVEDGVLRGRPSTPEFQAKKTSHFGYEPRISAVITPPQFVARFSVRFIDGTPTALTPFIEFGHHVCRLLLSPEGAELLAEGESLRVATAPALKFEPGQWYHALAEMKGEEFVLQFDNGTRLYAKHPSFAKPAASGANGVGFAGTKGGVLEIDNVTLWTIKDAAQPTWTATRATFPSFTPEAVSKKKGKK